MGESGSLLTAGSTYTVSKAFCASINNPKHWRLRVTSTTQGHLRVAFLRPLLPPFLCQFPPDLKRP